MEIQSHKLLLFATFVLKLFVNGWRGDSVGGNINYQDMLPLQPASWVFSILGLIYTAFAYLAYHVDDSYTCYLLSSSCVLNASSHVVT